MRMHIINVCEKSSNALASFFPFESLIFGKVRDISERLAAPRMFDNSSFDEAVLCCGEDNYLFFSRNVTRARDPSLSA